MSERPRRWKRIIVLCIPFIAIVAALSAFQIFRSNDPLNEVEFWGDRTSEEILEENALWDDLKKTVFPEFRLDRESLEEGVNRIENHLDNQGIKPISFVFGEGVELGKETQFHLDNAPVSEILSYLCLHNRVRFELDSDRTIRIITLDTPPEVVEGYFRVLPSFISTTGDSKSQDVTEQLVSAGVYFGDTGKAVYYPDKEILWAKTTSDQMDLIDAYLNSVICCQPDLPWYYRAYEKVWLLLNPAPPAPVIPPPATPFSSPDPFGSPGEPDPFGR